MRVTINADGASRGNPGPAAIGATVKDEQGKLLSAISARIGRTTNNQAEYRALIAALKEAIRLGATGIDIHLDSELLVRQLTGRYRVKHPALKPLYEETRRLLNAIRREGRSLAQHLARPEVTIEQLLGSADDHDPRRRLSDIWRQRRDAVETVAIDLRYAGYLEKELAEAARLAEMDAKRIPASLDYAKVPHLRAEARERLSTIRPQTLGQALRVSGITPADITVLMIYLTGRNQSVASQLR